MPLEPLPESLPSAVRALADALAPSGFTADGIAEHLGPNATAALYRGEPGVVLTACDASPLSCLIRFFLVREPASQAQLDELLSPDLVRMLLDATVIRPAANDRFAVALDLRPHVLAGQDRLIVSDLDASMTAHVPGPDHVLGVGSASLSLLSASPETPVGTVLDLGCGSGVQAVAQAGVAQRVVATDVHPRALEMARATLAANRIDNVELRQGPWFEPVADERFDRIVANPPFVVGLPEVGHVYRDSGLSLDGATELVVGQAPAHLAEGATACILGAWVHRSGESWRSRVASWLPSRGVSAWVLERDVVDPGQYVSTWLADESVDVRSPEAVERTERWLAHFRDNDVEAIGFGWIFLREIGDNPTEITAEDLSHPFTDPLGPEVDEYFARAEWLRGRGTDDILDAAYMVRPGVALERVSVADAEAGMGFAQRVTRVSRMDGPRFTHEVDDGVVSILSGLHPQGLPLREVVGLLVASQGVDDPAEHTRLENNAAAIVVDCVRHGLVLPAEIIAKES